MNQTNVLIIADPLESFKVYKDTTYAIIEELSLRKINIHHCLSKDLSVKNNLVTTTSIQFDKQDNFKNQWFKLLNEKKESTLNEFDAVLMRTDPPFDMQYLYATHLLTLAEKQGAKVFNSGFSMREFNEKLSILNYPEFTIPTLVSTKYTDIFDFLKQYEDIIIKPLDGMGGMGIFRLRTGDPNIKSILEILMNGEMKTIMAQKFIPEISNGDKRVLVIDGKPIPYALARIPSAGETRGNLAAGGKGIAQPLSDHDLKIALSIGPTLKEKGILLAGLDIIGNYLTEINVTSPTCFREIMTQTSFNVASHFVDALLSNI